MQHAAECAGGAGEYERRHADHGGLLQQVQCSGDVGVDEFLLAVRADAGIVQGGGVEDGVDAAQASGHGRAIDDRPEVGGERAGLEIEPDRLVIGVLQPVHEPPRGGRSFRWQGFSLVERLLCAG